MCSPFPHIPVHLREPQPAMGVRDVGVDASLQWRSGREAVSLEVHLGTDWVAVCDGEALVETTSDSIYDPGGLDLGPVYRWKIGEVNEAELHPL